MPGQASGFAISQPQPQILQTVSGESLSTLIIPNYELRSAAAKA
jgi:hypothetical protein